MDIRQRAEKILAILKKTYPGVKIALRHENALQLLIATILSAQCTDERVNMVTPALFRKYKTAADFAKSNRATLESMIRSTGFFRNKAVSIQKCCAKLVSDFGGKVPATMDELVSLPGVGRKTANVVLGVCYDTPGIVVDTHVLRVSQRLGLTKNTDAVKVEFDLQKLFPQKDWTRLSFLIQAHGRSLCTAKRPDCPNCPLLKLCTYGLKTT